MTYKLLTTLAVGAALMATPAGAGGLIDWPPDDPCSLRGTCVPMARPDLVDPAMYRIQHQDPAETRHQELIGQIKSLEDTIRIIDAERLMPR